MAVGGTAGKLARDSAAVLHGASESVPAPGTSSIVSMPPTHKLARSCAFDEAVRTRRRLIALETPTSAMAAFCAYCAELSVIV